MNNKDLFQLLKGAYESGDVLAVLQAAHLAKKSGAALPVWALEALEDGLLEIFSVKKTGKRGRGNKLFGFQQKAFIRCVRASAYFYIRTWQKKPEEFGLMPRNFIQALYSDPSLAQHKGFLDAARHASNSLKGTPFRGNAATIRKASVGMKIVPHFGRLEVEERLGLRTKAVFNGPPVFGPPIGPPPEHVAKHMLG